MSKKRIVCIAAFLVLLFEALPSEAHYVYGSGWTWSAAQSDAAGSDICVTGRAEVSHGANGNGYEKGSVEGWDRSHSSACSNVSGKIQTALYLILWRLDDGGPCRDRNNGWCDCKDWGWFFMNGPQSKSWTFPDVPCGPGTYGVTTGAYGKEGNIWRGGWIWSGAHDLPIKANPGPRPASPNLTLITKRFSKSPGIVPLPIAAVPM